MDSLLTVTDLEVGFATDAGLARVLDPVVHAGGRPHVDPVAHGEIVVHGGPGESQLAGRGRQAEQPEQGRQEDRS